MRPVERSEVLKIGDYEAIREPFRARVIAEKKLRRVALGPHATCLFENHDTVLLQIQEMLRTERISREASILHEIETYNELVPGDRELSATIMLEVDDREAREKFLVDAAGIHERIELHVDGEVSHAVIDPARVEPGRTSAVLYLKFPLTDAAIAALRAGGARVAVTIGHPAYEARADLGPQAVKSLAEDFDG